MHPQCSRLHDPAENHRTADALGEYPFRAQGWGVALIPKDKQFASVLGGENLAVIKGENSGEAIKFLTYFADPKVMNNFEKDFGYFPPRKDVASDPLWTKDPLLQIFSEEMQYARPRPASPQWPGISKAISAALVKSLSQYADPIENAKEAQAKIDQLLK
ncbi:ABC-type glycerol-3-phosphate transport system substrate-binding protein [Paenibacillus sp. V4I9]|uniref:extracellular solute-binding protein n=1 Tax=Paenibacillus sp. V4I9 TaxID=3042308 RepID=UPI0027888C97|nr:extracellular solute-binding protein [Paenibacillus sp. V4I9]MDQ0885296.1 ABC-type glycerol-3-phosphate transport system substrate-binding protein [Paenibacillus sp. V4I9]